MTNHKQQPRARVRVPAVAFALMFGLTAVHVEAGGDLGTIATDLPTLESDMDSQTRRAAQPPIDCRPSWTEPSPSISRQDGWIYTHVGLLTECSGHVWKLNPWSKYPKGPPLDMIFHAELFYCPTVPLGDNEASEVVADQRVGCKVIVDHEKRTASCQDVYLDLCFRAVGWTSTTRVGPDDEMDIYELYQDEVCGWFPGGGPVDCNVMTDYMSYETHRVTGRNSGPLGYCGTQCDREGFLHLVVFHVVEVDAEAGHPLMNGCPTHAAYGTRCKQADGDFWEGQCDSFQVPGNEPKVTFTCSASHVERVDPVLPQPGEPGDPDLELAETEENVKRKVQNTCETGPGPGPACPDLAA